MKTATAAAAATATVTATATAAAAAACLLAALLPACVADATDPALDQTASALTGTQIEAMNAAADGTGLAYSLTGGSTLALAVQPTPDLSQWVRVHRPGTNHIIDVIDAPDANCHAPTVRVGPATTSWLPVDPCTPDATRSRLDIAGANLRIVGNGVSNADGTFTLAFQVIDAHGRVVFDSARY